MGEPHPAAESPDGDRVELSHTKRHPMTLSFPSRQHHTAALYDACALILDTYRESDLFEVYEQENLEDHVNFAATAREIMGLIAEGSIH